MSLLFGASRKSFKKIIKAKLMLCKSLFIRSILQYKVEAPYLQKWAWHVHSKIIYMLSFEFQYRKLGPILIIKSKQIKNKFKNLKGE